MCVCVIKLLACSVFLQKVVGFGLGLVVCLVKELVAPFRRQ